MMASRWPARASPDTPCSRGLRTPVRPSITVTCSFLKLMSTGSGPSTRNEGPAACTAACDAFNGRSRGEPAHPPLYACGISRVVTVTLARPAPPLMTHRVLQFSSPVGATAASTYPQLLVQLEAGWAGPQHARGQRLGQRRHRREERVLVDLHLDVPLAQLLACAMAAGAAGEHTCVRTPRSVVDDARWHAEGAMEGACGRDGHPG